MWDDEAEGSVSLPMTVPRVRRLVQADEVWVSCRKGGRERERNARLVDKGAFFAPLLLPSCRLGASQVNQVL